MNKYLEKIAEGLREDLRRPRSRLKAHRGVKKMKGIRSPIHKIKTPLKPAKRLRDKSMI
jgi:hypothetical protein